MLSPCEAKIDPPVFQFNPLGGKKVSQNQVFLQKGLLSFLFIWAGKQDLLSDNENTHKKAGCPLV